MSIEQLGKKLSREFARNRKKTCILGALLVVAIYFWVPLVGDWLFPESAKANDNTPAVAKANQPVTAANASPPVSDVTALLSGEEFGWQKMIAMVETPPTTLQGDGPLASRNPFTPVAQDPVVNEPEIEVAATTEPVPSPPVEISPASLGMKLTGVFVMRNERVAIIDGAGYRPRDVIEVDSVGQSADATESTTSPTPTFAEKSDAASSIEFEVSAIHVDTVELKRHGESYTLHLQGETKSKAIEVTRYKPRRLP